MKQFMAFLLCFCINLSLIPVAQGATLGPATTYEALQELADQAKEGDVLLVSGDLSADGFAPFSTQVPLSITSFENETATLRNLRLDHAAVTFRNIDLHDSLSISGTSHVELASGVNVVGAPGRSGITFDGNGTLIMYPSATVTGGHGCDGVTISHRGGEFYAGIEGTVRGGKGSTGGAGLTISPLKSSGTLMISGAISGGEGDTLGGHALNLYDLSGNAFITVSGTLIGGSGVVGGDGIQLVAARDSVSVGIEGNVRGGLGEDYGGDALILMNLSGASSINLGGSLTGGDVTASGAQPGMSLLVVGEHSVSRTRVNNCHLEDGKSLSPEAPVITPEPTLEPDVTPLPEITSAVDAFNPLLTPTPSPTATPLPTPVPESTPTPDIAVTPIPSDSSVPERTARPDVTAGTESSADPNETLHPADTPAPVEGDAETNT